MRCEELDKLRFELDRDDRLDPIVREAAVAHAADCPRCASRLARARGLTSELRELSESTDAVRAPESTNARILASFHRRRRPKD